MTEFLVPNVSKAAYLDCVEPQTGHGHERVRRQIVQDQSRGTVDHSRIAARSLALLSTGTDCDVWRVLTGDFAIDVDPDGDSIRFPDVSVIAAPADGRTRPAMQEASGTRRLPEFATILDRRDEMLALAAVGFACTIDDFNRGIP